MADVPDINPSRPIWPTRRDERTPSRRRRRGQEGEDGAPQDSDEHAQDEHAQDEHAQDEHAQDEHKRPDDGHIDEYV